jgi:hypothetical protein
MAEKETDLKMKSQIRPRRITIELLINVKGINVILHGLRPVPMRKHYFPKDLMNFGRRL